MKKETNEKEMAIITNNMPVVDVLSALKEELANLQQIASSPFETSGDMNEIGFTTNLKSELKSENLVRAFSVMCAKEKAYNDAQDRLQLKSIPAFTIAGQSVDKWEKDIKLRVQIIQIEERRKELETLVAEGTKFLTEKDQYNMYLTKLAKAMGK